MAKQKEPDLSSLPKAKLEFIEPMLAKLTSRVPKGDAWIYEIKLDGYRTMAMKHRGAVTLLSRRGHRFNDHFPGIAPALEFLPDDTIVDGEVVAIDEKGKPSFGALQNSRSRTTHLYFYLFDLLVYKAKDLRKLPFSKRRQLLEQIRGTVDPIRLSLVFADGADDLITAVKKQGLEGIVAKRIDSVYESGLRTGAWVKYKTNQGHELVIGGYMPGSNGFENLLTGYYEGKDLIFIDKVKNGFTPGLRRSVAKHFRGLETSVCPFSNLPEPKNARRWGKALTEEVMKECRWLKPKLVAQVEFTEWTKENHLRHSRFVALRDDKDPMEVTRE